MFRYPSAVLGLLGLADPARARVLEVDRVSRHHLPARAARPAVAVVHGQGQDHHLGRRHPAFEGEGVREGGSH